MTLRTTARDESPGAPTGAIAIAGQLRAAIAQATPRLAAISERQSAQRPAPGKWSPREIIGHLIDSAANNHARFVVAQSRDDLVFTPYDQEAWVRLQHYQDVAWSELVELWRVYNRHVAHVIAVTPHELLTQPRSRHNLDRIAWKTVLANEPATLGGLMQDYVEHMLHHLRQVGVA